MRTASRQPAAQDWELTLGDLLRRASVNWPDQEALVIGRARMSYRSLNAAAQALARRLLELGIARGNHVALMGNNTAEWVIGYFGVLRPQRRVA